jgi:transcriptional regulator with XRE-family HTH domain
MKINAKRKREAAPAVLGARLRTLRQERNMTLDVLAEATGLDKGYLSRIERGLKAPSIATVMRLSAALDAPVSELFGESVAEHAVRVVRKADRIESPAQGRHAARFEALSRAGAALEAFVVYPNAEFSDPADSAVHPGEEMLMVLTGAIEMRFADRGFVLEQGDCVQFLGHLAHRLRRVGDEPASALVVVVRPPSHVDNARQQRASR